MSISEATRLHRPRAVVGWRRWRPLLALAAGVLLLGAAIKALAPLWDWLLGSVAGLDLSARVGRLGAVLLL